MTANLLAWLRFRSRNIRIPEYLFAQVLGNVSTNLELSPEQVAQRAREVTQAGMCELRRVNNSIDSSTDIKS